MPEDQVIETSGVESEVPAAEGQEPSAIETGVESQGAAEPEKQNNFEKAFAKRLSEAQAKWEQQTAEKYKDYDDLRTIADYFRESNNLSDFLSLKEAVELERLQSQAAQQNVPVEVMQRIQQLEAKAAKGEQLEQQMNEERGRTEFETSLKQFAEGKTLGDKPLDHKELWQYMHDNQTSSPEVAYKAMKADLLEQQVQNAEKEGVKKFLQAKGSIPTVTGNTSQGATPQQAPKTLAEARARAMSRLIFNE